MKKVLAIIGPTASGKSSFAIRCAQELNGEIISGDSIQIYRGLDIGSAKVSDQERKMAVHHLIDIKEPNERYSVAEFQKIAREKIEEITSRGHLPIIAGGTGLYIKACLHDFRFMDEQQKDDPFDDLSNEEIYARLMEYDPKALEKIHINNRKRMVRALNVYMKHDVGISTIQQNQEHKPIYDAKIIGLTLDRDLLSERINQRVDQMVDDGLIEEIRGLLERGIGFDCQSMQGIGYKEFRPYFNHEAELSQCIEEVKKNTRRFSKRQYTYFRNQLDVDWHTDQNKAMEAIEKWLREKE